MRSILTVCAAAIAIMSTPALANEGRAEVRGGIAWASGVSNETIGVSFGYDVDIGENFYFGIEAIADTDLDISSPVLGLNGRAGFKVGNDGKLFVTAGYAYDTESEFDDFAFGAGYQHNLNSKAMVSVQYQRYLDTDINRAMIGLGYRF